MADTSFGALMESAKDAGYGPDEIVTPGTYEAEVVVSNTKFSSKGKRQWGVKYKLRGGPHDGTGIWQNMYVSPESPTALSILLRDLANLGADAEFLGGLDYENDQDAQAIADRLVGAVVRIKVETGAFNGEDKNEVKAVLPASGTPAPRATTRTPDATSRQAAPKSPF